MEGRSVCLGLALWALLAWLLPWLRPPPPEGPPQPSRLPRILAAPAAPGAAPVLQWVPAPAGAPTGELGRAGGGPLSGWQGLLLGRPLDLSRAGAEDLEALPGIGPSLAAAILAQRERVGGFRRIDDLLAVPGVGRRTVERLRPWVTPGSGPGRPGAAPALLRETSSSRRR